MTNTKITKSNHCFRVLVALAALATVMTLLVASTAKPSYATGTTFTVTSNQDDRDANPGDRICDTGFSREAPCTLRAAIQEANASAGADTIDFNIIPAFRNPDTGVATITPVTALPDISGQVTINGYTQEGAARNTLSTGTDAKLKVRLDGGSVSNGSGLHFNGSGASNSLVEGLVIDRFAGGAGIQTDADSVVVRQNFIGTDPAGANAGGNFFGVLATANNGTVVGGPTPQDANLISGNLSLGVSLGNVASDAVVSRNLIGTDRSGTKALGNHGAGVKIADASHNSVRNNTIAFNGSAGVSVTDSFDRNNGAATANTILSNSIFSNDGIGIDLVPFGLEEIDTVATPNDAGDGDTGGGNDLQNKPVLTSARTVSGKTTIKGKLNSHADQSYKIQFFSNPSGTDEGRKLIGQRSVTTDGSGNVTFGFSPATKVALGRTITATATRASSDDTSEFSAPRTVTSS